jgi:hypothetical protein
VGKPTNHPLGRQKEDRLTKKQSGRCGVKSYVDGSVWGLCAMVLAVMEVLGSSTSVLVNLFIN